MKVLTILALLLFIYFLPVLLPLILVALMGGTGNCDHGGIYGEYIE